MRTSYKVCVSDVSTFQGLVLLFWCKSLPVGQGPLIHEDSRLVFLNLRAAARYLALFFFFSWRCNPWWVLACFTILFHNLLYLHFSLQFLTFIFFKSSSTWSSHLSLGLSIGLDEHGAHSVSFLTVLVVSILITCAAWPLASIIPDQERFSRNLSF